MSERLTPTPPFDFLQMLRRPLSRPSRGIVIRKEQGSYTKAVQLPNRAVAVTVVSEGSVEKPLLRMECDDDLSQDEWATVVERVRQVFSTDVEIENFYRNMAQQAQWAELIQTLYGVRPIQDADLFESMVKVIVGQQLNVKFAATLVERLVDFGRESVTWQGVALPVFPSAERVASWSYEDLRSLSFSQRKAEYVIDFAKAVTEGTIDLEALRQLPDASVYDVLLPLRGIGRWTVECFLLFGMGRTDVMPAADIGVQNAIAQLYRMPVRPKEDEVRRLSESWAPWRSYATYYLWQSLIRPE